MILSNIIFAQVNYNMQDLTVYECEGVLTDSESNALNPSWYSHDENLNFTICPPNAIQITITFNVFSTEPINDYLTIYDGPDNTYPVLGVYSGTNLPPQIVSSGCITIGFFSDQNIAEEGFELSWQTDVSIPSPPVINLTVAPTCSTTILNIELDQLIHCDSVFTSVINVSGQINQSVVASPLNCMNDSTNLLQLNLSPGLNESGVYNIYLENYFPDDCGNIWNLSSNYQFVVDDCPLQVDLTADNTTICLGDCADLYVNVDGGDSTSYNYSWSPAWMNSPGFQTVCPTTTTQYIVTVSDNGTSSTTSDTITINVVSPPVAQNNISICQNQGPTVLTASPFGGNWSGTGIVSSSNGVFSPNGLTAGVYTIDYSLSGCSDDMEITILEINAGEDISVCPNAPIFNLNSSLTTPGGIWSGNGIQSNGDINVGSSVTTIPAIYTLSNGCSDTILVNVDGINVQADDTICQNSGIYTLNFSPLNGVWSVPPVNPLINSNCITSINNFPYQIGWEGGFNNWSNDPGNDFDWSINNGGTPSAATGPSSAIQGLSYVYTEASGSNHPDKTSVLVSPCFNLTEYDNPVLHFWYHQYGIGQGSFSIDIITSNGANYYSNVFQSCGDQGNQWNEVSIDLTPYISSEVWIRLRVVTGDWQSDVAVDKLSLLGGPVTSDGNFLTDVASPGEHNLIYTIEGCEDYVDIYVKEINAGSDQIVCPTQSAFNVFGSPSGGIWSGSHITNSNLGTFNPSIGLGQTMVTYSLDGCTDTAVYNVVDTDIFDDTLFVCSNGGAQILDLNIVPRTPWNGTWSGNGIVSSNFPGEFSPGIAGIGNHIISYTANSCVDSFIVKVLSPSMLHDTLICVSSPDIILNIDPVGGYWGGNGILNSNTGLFSPSSLSIGDNLIGYMAPNGCLDTFTVEIYNDPVLSFSGFDNYYCFKDTVISINVNPLGGVLTGNGIDAYTFNPSEAGVGYHNIYYTYGAGDCSQTIDTVIFVENKFVSETYYTDDTICLGELSSIGVNVSGGTSNYSFNWNNSTTTSFNQLVSPNFSTSYIVTSSDGCSDDNIDTIDIFVLPSFELDFSTSEKQCYGEIGYAVVNTFPIGNYSYQWNTNPVQVTDSIYSFVNKNYTVEVTDQNTECILSDTITIPGYENIFTSFFTNINSCVSVLNGEIQFLNSSLYNGNELSDFSYWDFGDGTSLSFDPFINPVHTYTDTGTFDVSLVLVNNALCSDTFITSVCVIPESKIFAPNSFTPNGDNCNDNFYLTGLGDFIDFSIKIYKRWGGDVVYESADMIYLDNFSDNNICNDKNLYQEYYKMGEWDGKLENGEEAVQGTYVFMATYYLPNDNKPQYLVGNILLIR